MIYDVLSNAKMYAGLNADVDKVLEAAKAYTPENFPKGQVVIEEGNVYMNMANYETHGTDTALAEAHQQFIDVMVMIDGCETIYVKDVNKLSNVTKPYDPEIEALLASYDADATPVRMEPGNFCILFPQDAHSPGCHTDGPCTVKKIIGKVRIR